MPALLQIILNKRDGNLLQSICNNITCITRLPSVTFVAFLAGYLLQPSAHLPHSISERHTIGIIAHPITGQMALCLSFRDDYTHSRYEGPCNRPSPCSASRANATRSSPALSSG